MSSEADGLRVLIVDDHPILRRGVRHILGRRTNLDVVGEAGTVQEAVHAARTLRPHVIVLDIHLPDGSGLDVMRALERESAHIVVYSMGDQPELVLAAVRAGALGFVTKSASVEHLISAVLAASRGVPYFAPEAHAALRSAVTTAPPLIADLTRREREVIPLLSEGLSSKEIGIRLAISPRTVDSHRDRIMKKLGVHNVVGIVRYAVIHGLMGPSSGSSSGRQ
jgi:DNA-binding NarL/FixJ family response regulator